nr:hypothetical protein [Deltaproteobacteria bacterium]
AAKLPVAPEPRSSGKPLIILLVLVLAAAAAYFAWRYLIREQAPVSDEAATTAPGAPVAPVAPPEPPKPVEPTAKIEIAGGVPRDVISVFAGKIESIDTAERDVKSSDVLARLAGAKRLEGEMATITKEIDTRVAKTLEGANNALTKAQAANNAEAVKAAEAQIAKLEKTRQEKQDLKVQKEDALEKLLVRAPFDGKVTVVAKAGQTLGENTVVAKITPQPAPSALFKLEKNMTIERGLAVPVALGEKLHTCTVAESTVDGTRVVCPEDPALVEGADVTLKVEQQ